MTEGVLLGLGALLGTIISGIFAYRRNASESKKNNAQAGDYISEAAIKLVQAMEVRLADAEARIRKLQELHDGLAGEMSQVIWLHDRLPQVDRDEFSLVFDAPSGLRAVRAPAEFPANNDK